MSIGWCRPKVRDRVVHVRSPNVYSRTNDNVTVRNKNRDIPPARPRTGGGCTPFRITITGDQCGTALVVVGRMFFRGRDINLNGSGGGARVTGIINRRR